MTDNINGVFGGVISNNKIHWEFVDDEVCITCEEIAENESDEQEEDEDYFVECAPEHTKLIGAWYKDYSDMYCPDPDGEFSAIVGEIYTQVVLSKTIAENKKMCSPCYPNQIDLDSTNGNFSGYTLPKYLIMET